MEKRVFELQFMVLMCFSSYNFSDEFLCDDFFLQLTSFQPLSLIKVETILQLVTVGAELFFLRGLILKMCVFLSLLPDLLQFFFFLKCCNSLLYDVFQHGGSRRDAEQMDYAAKHPEFRYKTEFQSHEPEVH